MRKKPELVSPAGDLKKLKYAFAFGADAVYIGGREFSLRVRAKNFSEKDIEEGVRFAHNIGKKVYITLNAYLKNEELPKVREYLGFLQDIGVDGVIVSDPAVIFMAKRDFPQIELHLSTQQNVTNYLAARFYQEQGIKRIVLAREVTLSEIEKIKRELPSLEIEVFIHGAMCIAYSGRCLLSEYFVRRGANRGDCAQSCRWTYYLMEEKRPGEYLPIFEDNRGTYILSSKDLMTLPILKRLIDIGIESFKIEGRVKTLHYVSTVTYVYRKAICALVRGEPIEEGLYRELEKISHREYWSGFFDQKEKLTTTYNKMLQSQAEFTGEIEEIDNFYTYIRVKNRMKSDDKLEFLTPDGIIPYNVGGYFEVLKEDIWEKRDTVHPNDLIRIKSKFSPYSLMRRLRSK